jgi:methylated-DNA-[protein]-cysteine S-methyltransferase
MKLHYQKMDSPVGTIHIVANDKAILTITFESCWKETKKELDGRLGDRGNEITAKAVNELTEYFAGKRKTFSLPLARKGTAFQMSAWKALERIPYGKTRTYLEQALSIKRPKAMRAVGLANSKNPFAIVVPCHRVIGASGKLTGYAGGLEIKRRLLALEGIRVAD